MAKLGSWLAPLKLCGYPQVAGSRNTLAIDCEGQVLSWGWNARGTLGHGHRRAPRFLTSWPLVELS